MNILLHMNVHAKLDEIINYESHIKSDITLSIELSILSFYGYIRSLYFNLV